MNEIAAEVVEWLKELFAVGIESKSQFLVVRKGIFLAGEIMSDLSGIDCE